jgi:hypothetical protein
MKVEQVYALLNSATLEIVGESAVLKEDLSNVVDFGVAVFDATSVDNYVRVLVDAIGKVVFNMRKYAGNVPSLLMDNWEYGAVMMKISAKMPNAVENESWELTDKQSYDVNVFHKPEVETKFFSKRVTFEVDMSFTEMQIKGSFASADKLNSFLSMIVTAIENSMTVKIDALVMRTLNTLIGSTFVDDYGVVTVPADYGKKSGSKAINLLYLYNTLNTLTLKVSEALQDKEFLRFASYYIKLTKTRLSKMSTLFNVGKKARFTSSDKLNIVLLNEFNSSADSFLKADTYNVDNVTLPSADIVPFWQGSGIKYDLTSVTTINIEIAKGVVNATGILGVMYDKSSVGVCNTDRRVTTNYNAKGEFYNNYYKFDCGSFNDENENFLVFFIA